MRCPAAGICRRLPVRGSDAGSDEHLNCAIKHLHVLRVCDLPRQAQQTGPARSCLQSGRRVRLARAGLELLRLAPRSGADRVGAADAYADGGVRAQVHDGGPPQAAVLLLDSDGRRVEASVLPDQGAADLHLAGRDLRAFGAWGAPLQAQPLGRLARATQAARGRWQAGGLHLLPQPSTASCGVAAADADVVGRGSCEPNQSGRPSVPLAARRLPAALELRGRPTDRAADLHVAADDFGSLWIGHLPLQHQPVRQALHTSHGDWLRGHV
mmetsp:Transcript_62338/g.193194  ORF Transcript_62338/g.193194 Transcript_62338/m.193194 type:complete len:269 (+) Transcript_62338:609-1415(+)